MEYSTLVLKNITRSKLFFAPLNRFIEPMSSVDLLALCEGDSKQAGVVATFYKNNSSWQLFEVFKGPFPSPEGTLENVSHLEVLAELPNAVPVTEEFTPKPKKFEKAKPNNIRSGQFMKSDDESGGKIQ